MKSTIMNTTRLTISGDQITIAISALQAYERELLKTVNSIDKNNLPNLTSVKTQWNQCYSLLQFLKKSLGE